MNASRGVILPSIFDQTGKKVICLHASEMRLFGQEWECECVRGTVGPPGGPCFR